MQPIGLCKVFTRQAVRTCSESRAEVRYYSDRWSEPAFVEYTVDPAPAAAKLTFDYGERGPQLLIEREGLTGACAGLRSEEGAAWGPSALRSRRCSPKTDTE